MPFPFKFYLYIHICLQITSPKDIKIMKYFPKSETAQTYYITHTQKKKKGKDPYLGSLNQGFLCSQKRGSGGAKKDKGLSDTLGAKILSEKKKEAREN